MIESPRAAASVPLEALRGELVRLERHGDGRVLWPHEDDAAQAHGLLFLCPRCVQAHGQAAHRVVVWRAGCGVPDAQIPPARRRFVGTGLHDLSVLAAYDGGPDTVYEDGGCNWWGFVLDGHVCSTRPPSRAAGVVEPAGEAAGGGG